MNKKENILLKKIHFNCKRKVCDVKRKTEKRFNLYKFKQCRLLAIIKNVLKECSYSHK